MGIAGICELFLGCFATKCSTASCLALELSGDDRLAIMDLDSFSSAHVRVWMPLHLGSYTVQTRSCTKIPDNHLSSLSTLLRHIALSLTNVLVRRG